MFVPVANIVMLFMLGAKGSAWAWRNSRWTSVEHFKRVQRRWAIWGAIAWGVMIPLVAVMVFATMAGLSDSQAYKLAVAELNASPRVVERVGTPMKTGLAMGSMGTSGNAGDADLSFDVTGPKGSGTASLKAIRTFEAWTLTELRFKPEDGAETITLVSAGQTIDTPRLGHLRLLVAGTDKATTTLRPEDRKVELAFGVVAPKTGTVIEAVWRQLDAAGQDLDSMKSSLTLKNDNDDSGTFTITVASDWRAGPYRIDVTLDGAPVRSIDFTVAP